MIRVEAIIREDSLTPVVERLLLLRIRGLSVLHVRGSARGDDYHAISRGSLYAVQFVSKLLIEWYGPDNEADAVVRAIERFAATGVRGDGKIFVQAIEEAIRIRTGERGLAAV